MRLLLLVLAPAQTSKPTKSSMTDLFCGLLAGNGADLADDLLPAFGQILERGVVPRRHEAGMHETQPCAAIDLGESPGDDRVEARAILRIAVMPASPRIGQALVTHHLEHLAMDRAIPCAGRRRLP